MKGLVALDILALLTRHQCRISDTWMILKSDRLLVFIQNENYEHYLEETVKVLDKIAKFVIQDAKIIEYIERT